MKNLFEAIYSKYSLGTGDFAVLRNATTGGMRLVRQVEQQSFPYIVFTHVVGTISYTSTSTLKEATIQFSVFDDDFDGAIDIYQKLCNAFDDAELEYEHDSAIIMLRQSETGPFLFEDIWQITVDYQVMREGYD